jgi:hypothetical protein
LVITLLKWRPSFPDKTWTLRALHESLNLD